MRNYVKKPGYHKRKGGDEKEPNINSRNEKSH